jgi:uncharacterized protein
MSIALQEIKACLADLKPSLNARFGVSEIGIFGSYVRGEQKRGSDIDLLVSFETPVTLFGLYDLQSYLSRKLQRKVDLALKNGLKEHVGQHILSEVQYI